MVIRFLEEMDDAVPVCMQAWWDFSYPVGRPVISLVAPPHELTKCYRSAACVLLLRSVLSSLSSPRLVSWLPVLPPPIRMAQRHRSIRLLSAFASSCDVEVI